MLNRSPCPCLPARVRPSSDHVDRDADQDQHGAALRGLGTPFLLPQKCSFTGRKLVPLPGFEPGSRGGTPHANLRDKCVHIHVHISALRAHIVSVQAGSQATTRGIIIRVSGVRVPPPAFGFPCKWAPFRRRRSLTCGKAPKGSPNTWRAGGPARQPTTPPGETPMNSGAGGEPKRPPADAPPDIPRMPRPRGLRQRRLLQRTGLASLTCRGRGARSNGRCRSCSLHGLCSSWCRSLDPWHQNAR